jgi:hypothetical protein
MLWGKDINLSPQQITMVVLQKQQSLQIAGFVSRYLTT